MKRVVSSMSVYLKRAFRAWTLADVLLLAASILTVIVGFVLAGR
jgi:hypothetical protein